MYNHGVSSIKYSIKKKPCDLNSNNNNNNNKLKKSL